MGVSRQRPASRRLLLLLLACALPGCAIYDKLPIVVGLFRSPVGIELGDPNPPLDEGSAHLLRRVSDRARILGDRYAAIAEVAAPDRRCLARSDFSDGYAVAPEDAIDDLSDLWSQSKKTLVFVGLSGGGARAAVLSSHALSLLEQRYNELLPDRPEELGLRTFARLVDAYSSVSGGSLYAYHAARIYAGHRLHGPRQDDPDCDGPLPSFSGDDLVDFHRDVQKAFSYQMRSLGTISTTEFVKCFNPADRHTRTATWSEENPEGRWRRFTYEQIAARDKASLDIFWLRDESLEDSANLPEPQVLAAEIVDDLRASLNQIEDILAELQQRAEMKAEPKEGAG